MTEIGRFYPRFPREAIPADGATQRLRVHVYSNGDRLVRLTDCLIPASYEAVGIIQHRLNVRLAMSPAELLAASQFAAMNEQEDPIELPPVDVTVCQHGGEYPFCNPPPGDDDDEEEGGLCELDPEDPSCDGYDDSECEFYGDCEPGDGEEGDEGIPPGFVPAPLEPSELIELPDTVPPGCPTSDSRAVEWCDGNHPNQHERDLFHEAMQAMEDLDPLCSGIAERGRQLLDAGRIRFFGPDLAAPSGRASLGGNWMVINRKALEIGQRYSSYWRVIDAKGTIAVDLAWILSHEIGHTLGERHIEYVGQELSWRNESAERCGVANRNLH